MLSICAVCVLPSAPPHFNGSMASTRQLDTLSSFSFDAPERGPPRAYEGVRAALHV
jgi:hypothetical protein